MSIRNKLLEEILSATGGSGAVDNLTGGWANYNDLATQTTLFNVVGSAAAVKVPNDGAGSFTFEDFLPIGVSRLYNKTTEQFDLTGLSVGDMFGLRFDLEVTTSANSQEVEVSATFAIGSPSEFTSIIAQGSKKLSGSVRFFREVSFAAFNADFKDFPAELKISSDGNCTVKVNGYFLNTTLIGR